MKLRFAILLCLPLMLAGCKTTTGTTPPLAPASGYNSQYDQQAGQILAAARAFYLSVQQQSASGQMVLSPTEKQAFNVFGITLNGADAVYLAYHAGNATIVQVQTAVNQVQQQQAALPLPGSTK